MIDRRLAGVAVVCAGLLAGCGSSPAISPTDLPHPTLTTPIPTASASGSPAASDGASVTAYAAYEAVFLRLEVVDGSPEVVVIGVDAAGKEREIARLPDAWVAYRLPSGGGFLAPIGAVSASGLLAVPVRAPAGDGPLPKMQWEIVDLHQPDAAPVVVPGTEQGLEQLGTTPYLTSDSWPTVDWATGDRLGIGSRSCDSTSCGVWAFFDGRTGTPVEGRPHAEPMCRTRDRSGASIVLFDGGVVRRDQAGNREELVPPSGVTFACLAPDDSMIVHSSSLSPSSPVAGLIPTQGGEPFSAQGSFAGWLGLEP